MEARLGWRRDLGGDETWVKTRFERREAGSEYQCGGCGGVCEMGRRRSLIGEVC